LTSAKIGDFDRGGHYCWKNGGAIGTEDK